MSYDGEPSVGISVGTLDDARDVIGEDNIWTRSPLKPLFNIGDCHCCQSEGCG